MVRAGMPMRLLGGVYRTASIFLSIERLEVEISNCLKVFFPNPTNLRLRVSLKTPYVVFGLGM